ncbi:MAG: extracellular solute-binding protein [Candidatus Thermoplasmatota archaeon]|nr:extracellular solute-binding protein [Candidatus Thermoplasmatota archaeon]
MEQKDTPQGMQGKKPPMTYIVVAIVVIVVIIAGIGIALTQLQPAKSNKTVLTVNISLAPSEYAYYNSTLKPQFQQMYPNVTIQFTTQSASTVVSTLQAQEPTPTIDVVQQDNGFIGPLVSSGLVMNLTPYLSQLEPMNSSATATAANGSIIPAYYNEGNFSGTFYFFPVRGNVQLAYYNQSALNQVRSAGYTNITTPTNVTNLKADMWDLNNYSTTHNGLYASPFNMMGHGGASTPTQVFQWMAEFGGNPMAFNTTGDIAALTFLQNMEKTGLMSPYNATGYWGSYKGLMSNNYQYLNQWPYITSILANNGWNNTTIAPHNVTSGKELGLTHGFTGPNNIAQFIVGGDALGIVNNTPHLWAALHWIQFLDSKKVQIQLMQNLTWPVVNEAAYATPSAQSLQFKLIKYEESNGIFRPAVPWMTQWDNYFDSAWSVIMNGGNVSHALSQAHSSMYHYLKIYYGGTAYPSEYQNGTIIPSGAYLGPKSTS